MKIKELPVSERPYEKLEIYGPEVLSNAELLAIIIKTGTKDKTAVEIAQEILKYDFEAEGVNFLRNASIEELKNIHGVGRVKAIQLKALGEISVRLASKKIVSKVKIITPEDAARCVMADMQDLKQEVIKTILLDNQNQIIRIVTNAIGTLNAISLEPREIFKEPVKSNSPKIILVHNHPSGDITPSNKDIEFTTRMCNVGKVLGVEILDHIIIGGYGKFCSLKRDKKF